MNLKNIDSQKLKDEVYQIIHSQNFNHALHDKIKRLKQPHIIWQAYVETVDSLGQSWRSLGRTSYDISDIDYSLAHSILFQELPQNIKTIILVKMEELMKTRIFMQSDEALNFFKNI